MRNDQVREMKKRLAEGVAEGWIKAGSGASLRDVPRWTPRKGVLPILSDDRDP